MNFINVAVFIILALLSLTAASPAIGDAVRVKRQFNNNNNNAGGYGAGPTFNNNNNNGK